MASLRSRDGMQDVSTWRYNVQRDFVLPDIVQAARAADT